MKKMRKLIPAFAMLLVSAIMMSTASFAWFTMNDQVTATGMQIQAQTSGNLLISENKLTASTSTISVDFGGTNKTLKPITFTPAKTTGEGTSAVTTPAKWQEANGTTVDPLHGTTTGALVDVNVNDPGEYFAEYEVFLATAGEEALTGTLQFDLESLANADITIANAYTVAIYVADENDEIDWYAPYTFNYKQNKTQTGFIDTNIAVTVPSTFGKVAETAVGLRVIIRMYVDGALEDPDGHTIKGAKILHEVGDLTYNATQMANYTFYTDAAGTTVYDKTLLQEGQALSTVVSHYWTGEREADTTVPATYVNNQTVPTAGTSFKILFKINEGE